MPHDYECIKILSGKSFANCASLYHKELPNAKDIRIYYVEYTSSGLPKFSISYIPYKQETFEVKNFRSYSQ